MAVSNSTDRFNGVIASLAIKAPCVAVAIANLTLSGEQTVNGVAVVAGDRVLVIGQTEASENGIYDASSSAWARAADWDGNRDVVNGTFVTVATSTVGRNPFYQVTTANPITIGTTAVNFTLADGPNVSYALTAAEITSGLTVNDINDSFESGHVPRYGTNTTPGTTDMTAAIQAAFDVLDVVAVIPFGQDFRFISQLTIPDGGHVHFGGNLVRDFTTTNNNKKTDASIINADCVNPDDYIVDPGPFVPLSRDTGITITGNGEIKNSAAVIAAIGGAVKAGPHLALMASDDMYIGPITLRGPCNDWATIFWGDGIEFGGMRVRDQDAVFEDGLHVLSCDGATGFVDIESGDDAVAFINNYNLPLENVSMIARVVSQRGHAVRLGLNRTGATAAFGITTEKCKNIYIAVSGKAGILKNGLIRVESDITNARYDSVDGVVIDMQLEHGDTATHGGVNAHCIRPDGGVNMKFRGKITNPVRRAINANNTTNVEYDLDCDAPQDASIRSVNLLDCEETRLNGKYVANTVQAVTIDGGSTDIGATLTEIPTGLAGVRVQNSAVINFHGKVKRATAATTVHAIRNENTGAELYVGGAGTDVDDTDNIVQFIARPSLFRQLGGRGFKKSETIATASITIGGELDIDVLAEGGVSDTLSTIQAASSNAGQIVTLRNGEAVPATVTITVDNVGNIVVGSTYVLDDANKALKLEYDGANWQEVARY